MQISGRWCSQNKESADHFAHISNIVHFTRWDMKTFAWLKRESIDLVTLKNVQGEIKKLGN